MLHEELTKRIIGICFDVLNELGAGFLESVYKKALLIALRQEGLHADDEVKLTVSFRQESVGLFYADIVVENKILLEIKATKNLVPEHQAQVINYLKATGLEVGLLINFGQPKLQFKRLHG
jgi:GxxExxY protein